eukprot:5644379-Pleurochrysis_carterae.AAC.1
MTHTAIDQRADEKVTLVLPSRASDADERAARHTHATTMTATQKAELDGGIKEEATKKGSQMCRTTIAKDKLFPTGGHTRPTGRVMMMAPKSVTTTERRPRMDMERYAYTPCLLRNIH